MRRQSLLSRFLRTSASSYPNADDNFDGCETHFMHDFHNASLLDFSNIVEMTSSQRSVRQNLHLSARSELITGIHQITLHFLSRLELIKNYMKSCYTFLAR